MKDILGFEGKYAITREGKVWSFPKKPRNPMGSFLAQSNFRGYKIVEMWKNGKFERIRVHRLVAEAFIPNPENKPYVNHKNCVKSDNRVENLEWVTHQENMQHARLNKRWEDYENKYAYKKRNASIIRLRNAGCTLKEIARVHSITHQRVCQLIKKSGI